MMCIMVGGSGDGHLVDEEEPVVDLTEVAELGVEVEVPG